MDQTTLMFFSEASHNSSKAFSMEDTNQNQTVKRQGQLIVVPEIDSLLAEVVDPRGVAETVAAWRVRVALEQKSREVKP